MMYVDDVFGFDDRRCHNRHGGKERPTRDLCSFNTVHIPIGLVQIYVGWHAGPQLACMMEDAGVLYGSEQPVDP